MVACTCVPAREVVCQRYVSKEENRERDGCCYALHVEVEESHHGDTHVHRAHELRHLAEIVVPHGCRDQRWLLRAILENASA